MGKFRIIVEHLDVESTEFWRDLLEDDPTYNMTTGNIARVHSVEKID